VTPLCSTCHGDCCVTKHGSVADHGAALALHSCPDCLDGFAPAFAGLTADQARDVVDAWLRAPDEPTELDDLRVEAERLRSEADKARRDERALIGTWLRQEAARYRWLEPTLSPTARALEATAYLIETHAPHAPDPLDPKP